MQWEGPALLTPLLRSAPASDAKLFPVCSHPYLGHGSQSLWGGIQFLHSKLWGGGCWRTREPAHAGTLL